MRIYLFFFLFILIKAGIAQEPARQPLEIEDFADWKKIENPIISNNGKYIAYELNPQKGDGSLIVNYNNTSDTISRGAAAEFSPENNFILFRIKQPEDTVRTAKLKKIKKEKMPKDSIGIYVFRHDSLVKFPGLKSFQIPEENAGWVAVFQEPEKAVKDSTDKRKSTGNKTGNLILFEVKTAESIIYRDVSEYYYAKKGNAVYFVQQSKDSLKTTSTLQFFDTGKGFSDVLFSSEGWIEKVTSDETGSKFAFLFSQDTIKEKVFALYYGENKSYPEKLVDSYSQGMPVGWSPSENDRIWFSENGFNLFLGTAESPEPQSKDTLPEDEKPRLDIWSWKDLKLQPQQNVEAEKEKKRTYLGVYHVDLNRFIQLADVNIREVTTPGKGNADVGLGYDESSYLRSSSWTGKSTRDYYLVDFNSGIKREIVKEQSFVKLSPNGKYVVWYNPEDSSYYSKSTDIENLEVHSLTSLIPVNFVDEENDLPAEPSPYGIAGWSEDDRFVYIYDRYDLWKIDPDGERVPVNITKAFGRRNKTRLRYVKLDKDLEYIPSNQTIILKAFDERTKSNGFFDTQLNSVKDPSLLLMEKFYFDNLKKAKNDNRIIWTKENVQTFPDLWTSNLTFEHGRKISDANPQQKNYIWPTVELVSWTSFSGEKLEGMLYKPENLDPNKKYPMIVYFYERNTDNLFRYTIPSPSRSIINKSFYASNGYLVFVPDITYKVGYPGQSAYNAIVSGTQYLINEFPYVDAKNIGLQGQSWGGYQTAYLITQTDLYAAAMAGAPVSNMTSAYGGIRWGSGLSRMFQYEHTQSRIGGTLWEKPLLYIENSPLFYAPKVNTPLLMMHNDKDTAVPWYQGIEFFVALRRLNKPVWMLSYNDEPHNLKAESWANRIDLSKRMFQFFNHYLKGKTMPEWMEKGVPATEKGENLGY